MKINFEKINTGEIGSFLGFLYPKVEANKESLLIQLLTAFGSCLGQKVYFKAAEDKHFTNLYVAIVGKSARGRKGQSLNMIKQIFRGVDDQWYEKQIFKGLSSGEGLIKTVSDEFVIDEFSKVEILKEKKDKRALIIESEFSSVLKMTQREGNILSQVLRDAWDSVPLEIMTKNDPMRTRNTHISIIGHITNAELLRFLSSTEIANGLGNRFIFIKGERDKKLPIPEPLSGEELEYMKSYLKKAIVHGQNSFEIKFTEEASAYWNKIYCSIDVVDCTIVGTLTARQEAQIRRLAMIISLFNLKDRIDLDSLVFAEQIFNYSIETLKEIYGNSTGDPLTDKILDLLKASPNGLSRSEIHAGLSKNYQKGSLDNSLMLLESQGVAYCTKEPSNGRPVERWFYKEKHPESNEINEESLT